ncbi:MAG: glycoside hydrolase [Coriobacteriia bacterium]|nr:glycoside hydrolase [Coriobacteriia bacterium]
MSPYDWDQLIKDENGRFEYFEDGVLRSRFGIDVSEHQKVIDWQAVAADGVDFAIIRLGHRGLTEGQIYLDLYYEENIRGAKEAGILVGIYFFSQAINEAEAREEAEFVLKILDGMHLDYPIAYDHEVVSGFDARANKLTGAEVSRCARAFFEVIQAAGYETLLYGNKGDLNRLEILLLESHDLWLAEYDAAHPTLKRDIVMWQYTSHGAVKGITTHVDLNIHFLPK